ncbi:hypothetical protein [Streptomyces sp. 049-1]|uniref:hypothetical protein n=1 Tax=Streptomyces sp. 049-1 TaxID=2789264 RepID=UPI00397FAB61
MKGPQPHGLSLAAYSPTGDADTILGVLAWCATAAGVTGLIFVGIRMALQLRAGLPGSEREHLRDVLFVVVACVLAATAGPLVAFLGDLSLL